MLIVIDIPESAKQAFDKAAESDVRGGYYDHNGVIGQAIKNGIALSKGITNGEVVTALFPDAKKTECTEYHYLAFAPSCNLECCNEDWWSAPFDYTTLDKEDGERECR